ncbi:MAG: Aromatic/aminoadipate aminotransferase 1 [Bathelium mastoideum]|nr:MAG: Aromatic/aminoadipate aminotransferase 1 [Bathelium mastoideum]
MAPPGAISLEAISDTSAVVIPNPLMLDDVDKRRTTQGKMVAGTAATADTELFKGSGHDHKPRAKRWNHRFSGESLSREGSSIKKVARFLKTPGLISLGGGLPSSEYFPFDSISVKVPTPPYFTETETQASGTTLEAGKYDLNQGKSLYDISTSFNYGQVSGSPQLLRFVMEHTELVHNPPYSDWVCCQTIGSTSALDMALRMLTTCGDAMLTEEYTFATAVETAVPIGVKVFGVPMDEQGLLATGLDEVLSSWDEAARGAKKPFLLYTVPTGQNPTGATQSEQRKRDIYAVAQKHDLFILEDDPYYFLQMQPYTGQGQPDVPPPSSREEFIKSLTPSLLKMDVDGRVMRMDSFSKVLAPGFRTGWITASEEVVQRYKMAGDVSTQGPNGISQLILYKLLDEHWGHGGFLDWLVHIRMEYTKRRDVILGACEKHLPREIVSWVPPAAGMFHWLRVDYTKHPHYPTKSIAELEEEIFRACVRHGTLVIKGSGFYADASAQHNTMFFRATYSAAPSDKIDEAIKRFGDAVRESFGITQGSNGSHS